MRKLFTLIALAVAVPFQARAANVDCSTLSNPLWLQIGDTQEALVRQLGRDLANSTTHPLTIIYITAGSCTNVPNIQAGTKITANPLYTPAGYDGVSTPPTCTNSAGHKIDVANAALFISTCGTLATPVVATTAQQGPIQAYSLVVPTGSSQTSITAEEAYFVFGFGNNDGFGASTPLSPWNDETQMFIRTSTKSTLLTWIATLSVPGDPTRTFTAAKFKGVPLAQSAQVETDVEGASPPEKGIGLLGAEVYDANRSLVKQLAFQWFGQKHAYFPDSNNTTFDKRNLRDGHYAPWSPTYWLQQVDGTGAPTNPDADFFIKLILGTATLDTVNPINDVIAVGLVPACAMEVNRTIEAGPLSPFAPTPSCSCYYDAHVQNGSSTCATCSAANPTCPGTSVCRSNFCEAR
jgi:hypothetical protein